MARKRPFRLVRTDRKGRKTTWKSTREALMRRIAAEQLQHVAWELELRHPDHTEDQPHREFLRLA